MAIDPITGYTVDDEHGGPDSGIVTTGRMARTPTAEQTAAAIETGRLNNQRPVWDSKKGAYTFVPMSPAEILQADVNNYTPSADEASTQPTAVEAIASGGVAMPDTTSVNPYPANESVSDRLKRTASDAGLELGVPGTFVIPRGAQRQAPQRLPAPDNMWTQGMQDADESPDAPGAQAPDVDRDKIDPLLTGLNSTISQIQALAGDNTGLSVALAQLASATQAAQSAILGQARSGNRRDRGLLQRQAVGEVGFTGQQAARDAATLRAQEEDSDRRFRLDALKTAGELGLNTAALEVDISKADQNAASNWINNEFSQLGINKQIDAQMAGNMMNFARDMAAIEFQYDQLDEASKQFIIDAELQKYGIDQSTYAAIRQAKESNKFKWGNFFTSLVGGAATGGTSALASTLLK